MLKILSYKEEQQLSNEELLQYYTNLREYLKQEKVNNLYLKFCNMLHIPIVKILNEIKKYDIEIRKNDNSKVDTPVIYVSTHQDFNDHFNIVLSIPENAIILNNSNISKLLKLTLLFNGVEFVDRNDEKSRFNSKINLMKYLSHGKSVVVFSEATWNCSPNKIHLPLHIGVVDMAKKMRVPIVPIVQEYEYDPLNYNVIRCIVEYGSPIYVNDTDNLTDKLEELSETISTIRYHLIEEKGINYRVWISNEEYIRYIESKKKGLSLTNSNMDIERLSIYGVDDDFYKFHHINDIPYDKNGTFLPTDEVKKLKKINRKHLKGF